MRFLCLLALLLIAACGSAQIRLQDPSTGKIVTCNNPIPFTSTPSPDIEYCATAYERQGYKRLPN
jgi:hypothetical protein